MARFRLSAARQHGERIAKDYGFDKFPIDPFAIAEAEDIMVEPKPADKKGVSGGIIFRDDSVGIFYATNIGSAGFQRFTIAHELGHYFLEGHPEEICKIAPIHVSRAGFTQGDSSIEMEADHFASGLLMPTHLVKAVLSNARIGLEGITDLSEQSDCSLTAAAIRAAECSPYPMAIVVSQGKEICYCFMSDGFKGLGRLDFLRKGHPLPEGATLSFNMDSNNVAAGKRLTAETTLADWFGGNPSVKLDEEIVGLGKYGHTLTVFSNEAILENPDEDEDDEQDLIESWTPKFARAR